MALLGPGYLLTDRYRFDRFIARGGMGEVWAAWDSQLDVPVAVKVMAPSTLGSPELVLRFEREAKAAAQIRTQHAVQVFGHGIEHGIPFIVMELLEGEDLFRRLRRQGRLTLQGTVDVVRGTCKALRRAHDLGIVHRDLKPANIFHARADEDEIVKVLDFGIAMLSHVEGDGRVTATGAILGTARYMAPEQAKYGARRVDHRADLWSLGAIAFETLTGKVPFPGNPFEILTKVFAGPPPLPSSVVSDLPPEVDRFFEKALACDPAARFQSAREMADAMMALVAAAPVESPSIGAACPARLITSSEPPAPLEGYKTTVKMPPRPRARSVVAQGRALRWEQAPPPEEHSALKVFESSAPADLCEDDASMADTLFLPPPARRALFSLSEIHEIPAAAPEPLALALAATSPALAPPPSLAQQTAPLAPAPSIVLQTAPLAPAPSIVLQTAPPVPPPPPPARLSLAHCVAVPPPRPRLAAIPEIHHPSPTFGLPVTPRQRFGAACGIQWIRESREAAQAPAEPPGAAAGARGERRARQARMGWLLLAISVVLLLGAGVAGVAGAGEQPPLMRTLRQGH